MAAFAQDAADPIPGAAVAAQLSRDNTVGRPGDEVTVTLEYTVDGGAYGLVTNIVNGLGGLIGLSPLPPVRLHSTATGVYE